MEIWGLVMVTPLSLLRNLQISIKLTCMAGLRARMVKYSIMPRQELLIVKLSGIQSLMIISMM